MTITHTFQKEGLYLIKNHMVAKGKEIMNAAEDLMTVSYKNGICKLVGQIHKIRHDICDYSFGETLNILVKSNNACGNIYITSSEETDEQIIHYKAYPTT